MARPRKERGDIPKDAPLPPGSKRDPARGKVKVYVGGRYVGAATELPDIWEMWALAMTAAEQVERAGATFQTVADKWLAARSWRRRTSLNDGTAYRRLVAVFGERPIASITASDIAAWLAVESRRVGDGTLKMYRQKLGQIFALAVDDRVISENPCDTDTVRKARPTYHAPKQPLVADVHLDKVIEHATPVIAVTLEIDRQTGLRSGELFALTVDTVVGLGGSNVVPLGGVPYLDITRQLNTKREKDDPNIFADDVKYPASKRQVPLTTSGQALLRPLVARALAARNKPGATPAQRAGLIFVGPRGGVMWATAYDDLLARAIADARVPKFTFRALRHQFSTRLDKSGAPIKVVQALMGHESGAKGDEKLRTTVDTYMDDDTTLAEKQAVIERAMQVPIGSRNPELETKAQVSGSD